MDSDFERMTAILFTMAGEYVQVSDYARTLGEMESTVTQLYCMAEKRPAAERFGTYGSIIVSIVRDAHAELLPPWEHIGD